MQIVMQLGLTMAGCIGFCFFVGLQIDKWLGTRGIFVTIFIFLGVIGGAMVTYRQIMEIYEDKDISPRCSALWAGSQTTCQGVIRPG